MGRLTAKEALMLLKDYAFSVGAIRKVVGGYAYRSLCYNQRTNRGRYIKLKKALEDCILVFDNKKGVIPIWKYLKEWGLSCMMEISISCQNCKTKQFITHVKSNRDGTPIVARDWSQALARAEAMKTVLEDIHHDPFIITKIERAV